MSVTKRIIFLILLAPAVIINSQTIRYSQGIINPLDVPSDFPEIAIGVSDNPSDGYLFLSNFVLSGGTENVPYLMILDNTGYPVFYRKMNSPVNMDFKRQPNGMYTYFDLGERKFYLMNQQFRIMDSVACVNGIETDEHELRILDNGHRLLLGNDTRTVDMSQVVNGGKRNAKVIGFVIQELDENNNLIFEWNTFDHFQITDAAPDIDLTALLIDYAHCNSIEIDNDNNILLSTRHFDEITKIDRTTGGIIWRWGGKNCKNNQFKFINDSTGNYFGFSHQHGVRRLPNGNIILFDNGNLKDPQFSRAVEYQIDEQAKTATLVWEYRNAPDVFSSAMGYAQRLNNGNTLIGWGQNDNGLTLTEITHSKTKAFELSFPDNIYSYRAFRFDVNISDINDEVPAEDHFKLYQNYPNPFNPETEICWDLKEAGNVKLTIYDVLGKEIAVLYEGYQERGFHSLNFSAEEYSLTSGIYFYKLQTEKNAASGKMVIMK